MGAFLAIILGVLEVSLSFDNAVVNASGCELISRGVPVKADEIEALMKNN